MTSSAIALALALILCVYPAAGLDCWSCDSQGCLNITCDEGQRCLGAALTGTVGGNTFSTTNISCLAAEFCPPLEGYNLYSFNDGVDFLVANVTCCDTDFCVPQDLPLPERPPDSMLVCRGCSLSSFVCTDAVVCNTLETMCYEEVVSESNGPELAAGCGTPNLCNLDSIYLPPGTLNAPGNLECTAPMSITTTTAQTNTTTTADNSTTAETNTTAAGNSTTAGSSMAPPHRFVILSSLRSVPFIEEFNDPDSTQFQSQKERVEQNCNAELDDAFVGGLHSCSLNRFLPSDTARTTGTDAELRVEYPGTVLLANLPSNSELANALLDDASIFGSAMVTSSPFPPTTGSSVALYVSFVNTCVFVVLVWLLTCRLQNLA